MFNLRTESQRQAYLAQTLRIQIEQEKQVQTRLANMLRSLAYSAAKVFEETRSPVAVTYMLAGHKLSIETVLSEQYEKVIKRFSQRVFNRAAKKQHRLLIETKDTENLFERLTQAWISEHALEQSELIARTTQNDIIAVILTGQREALGAREIARSIRKKIGDEISRTRAEAIAITETHNAATFADMQSVALVDEELNLQTKKIWLPAEDGRTRPEHAAMTRHPAIPLEDKFTVGGHKMSRPGDPAGGADQVIRCRCTLIYETEEDL